MEETVSLMDLVPILTSPACLSAFSSGLLFGAAWSYYFTRIKPKKTEPVFAVPIEERYEFPEPEDEYRLVLGIRNDLKMQKGKVAAQCGHASVDAYQAVMEKSPEDLEKWMMYGGTKITLKVESEEQMMELHRSAKQHKVLTSIIRDAGHTQVAPGSKTVIAIGPAPDSVLKKITGHLKLY